MFRCTIRDMSWLTAVVAMAVVVWITAASSDSLNGSACSSSRKSSNWPASDSIATELASLVRGTELRGTIALNR
jgi:hypothetical protein